MKYIKIFTAVGLFFSIIFALNIFNPIWWQNVKLQTTPLWGIATLSNNPLLPGLDKDLSSINTSTTRISPEKLFSGGPPKDGIPSIDNPKFESISETSFDDSELIIGLVIGDDVRAYPYAILNWHEIVNDVVGGQAVAVTYCPLCETNTVFNRDIEIDGEKVTTEFGVSGKLYESCLVMYDRTTDSLYSQPWAAGIAGEQTNTVLRRVPAVRTTIGAWKALYPESKIMTTETGHDRNYTRYPYGSYYTDNSILFDVSRQEQSTLPPKEISHIIFEHDDQNPIDRFSGQEVFFTAEQVREAGELSFDSGGLQGVARWNGELQTVEFVDTSGSVIPNMALFGFVYPAHFK